MEKIDFVIIWVDGNDKEWQKEKNKYKNVNSIYNGINKFRDWDILKFWFRGVEKYASWVNNIYFVTWGHLPKWLNTNNQKLKIINHKDFIPSEYLPTFNSRVIELYFHKIKDLSEKFVYFNDDVFIINKVNETDYFKNNKPVSNFYETVILPTYPNSFSKVGYNNASILNNEFNKREFYKKNLFKIFNYKNGIQHSIQSLLLSPYPIFTGFGIYHGSSSMLKKTYETLWNKYPDVLNSTSLHKFRDNDTNINQYLMKDYQNLTGNFVLKKKNFLKLVNVSKEEDLKTIKKAFNSKKTKEICINDDLDKTENIDNYIKYIQGLFIKKFPDKCSFEK